VWFGEVIASGDAEYAGKGKCGKTTRAEVKNIVRPIGDVRMKTQFT